MLEPEIAELLGAYVLDAVDDQEREEIERYLLNDAAARAEVARLRAVVRLFPLVFGTRPCDAAS